MLSDKLGELWVSSTDLLQDGLQHLRVLLHDLSELLELRIISQEVKVSQSTGWSASRPSASKGIASSSSPTRSTTTSTGSSLGCRLKQVN
jgi:hypothetical protein